MFLGLVGRMSKLLLVRANDRHVLLWVGSILANPWLLAMARTIKRRSNAARSAATGLRRTEQHRGSENEDAIPRHLAGHASVTLFVQRFSFPLSQRIDMVGGREGTDYAGLTIGISFPGMGASLAGESGKSTGSGGQGGQRPPCPPDPVLLWALVESIGRQRFNRSDGKSRVNSAAARTVLGPKASGKISRSPRTWLRPRRSVPGAPGRPSHSPSCRPGRGRGGPRPAVPGARRDTTAHRPSLRDGARTVPQPGPHVLDYFRLDLAIARPIAARRLRGNTVPSAEWV